MLTIYEYHQSRSNFIFVFHCKLLTYHLRFVFNLLNIDNKSKESLKIICIIMLICFLFHFLLHSYIGPCFTTKRELDGVGGSKVGV
jgi:hypothetical protein